MNRIALLAVVAIVSFTSCSKERTAAKVGHQEMGAHGMTSDWKFTLPQGDPAAGRKLFVEVECYKYHEIKNEKLPTLTKKKKKIRQNITQKQRKHQTK